MSLTAAQQAAVIKEETTAGANTALRVGTALEAILAQLEKTASLFLDPIYFVQRTATDDPGSGPSVPDRFLITDKDNLHENFGTIAGLANGDIVERIEGTWTIVHPVASMPEGAAVAISTTLQWAICAGGAWTVLEPPTGGSSFATPNVAWITTAGSDTTGDGSPGAPYATIQKALNEGFRVIRLGVGTFAGATLPNDNPLKLVLTGAGANKTALSSALDLSSCTHPVTLESDHSVLLHSLTMSLSAAANDTDGATMPDILLRGLDLINLSFFGAQGGVPVTRATQGGNGGTFRIDDCVCSGYVSYTAGEGGPGDNASYNGGVGGAFRFAHFRRSRFEGAVTICGGNGGNGLDLNGGDGGAAAYATSPSFFAEYCVFESDFLFRGGSGGNGYGTPGSDGAGDTLQATHCIFTGSPNIGSNSQGGFLAYGCRIDGNPNVIGTSDFRGSLVANIFYY